MYEYSHGGNAVYEPETAITLDLSANINPLGPPPGVAEAIAGSAARCTLYPDSLSTELRARIAEREDMPAERIFCGGGASDIIFRLPRLIGGGEKRVLLTTPSFSDYERSARSAGASVFFHELDEESGFAPVSALLGDISSIAPDIIFLCNPNNPTGILTPPELIRAILARAADREALVVIDECFMELAAEAETHSAVPLLAEHKNLVVLKAFTKSFSLPGIRLGYALAGSADIIDGLRFHGADWPVSAPASAAGLAAFESADAYLNASVALISRERGRVMDGLRRLGFTVFKSAANYVFFKDERELPLTHELGKRGIRIRDCSNFRGLGSGFYRVAVSSGDNNGRFLSAIEEVAKCENP